MKILLILFVLVAAGLFSLLHDTFVGQIGCGVIGGLGGLMIMMAK